METYFCKHQSQQAHNLCATFIDNKHRHGEAKVLEVLTNAEKVSGDGVVESEVFDGTFNRRGDFGGAILQPRATADLGVRGVAELEFCRDVPLAR